MVWCITYAKKINNKDFDPRARSRFENGTDPNQQITGRSPKRESEALRPNIGAVREPGVLLFRFGPEPQAAQHPLQLVAQVPMAACPRAAVAGTRMRVIPFRIEPTAPRPAPSRTTSAARTPLGLERHPEPEPNQGCVLPVEEGEAVLRRGNGEPHSRPSAGEIFTPE